MQAFTVLVIVPVLVGGLCAGLFRGMIAASSTAVLAAPLAVFLCMQGLAPEAGWNWLATISVAPLATGFAVAAVLAFHGRQLHRKPRRPVA
jgi:hypothetical protein